MITLKEAERFFSYDPETGSIKWKEKIASKIIVGDEAGTLTNQGYIQIRFNGKFYRAHRIAWLLTHGHWPNIILDHINGIPSDNRLSNLRECTHSENSMNQKGTTRNKSGVRGVKRSACGNKWLAQVTINKKRKHLGTFDSLIEAASIAKAARNEHYGEFANHG